MDEIEDYDEKEMSQEGEEEEAGLVETGGNALFESYKTKMAKLIRDFGFYSESNKEGSFDRKKQEDIRNTIQESTCDMIRIVSDEERGLIKQFLEENKFAIGFVFVETILQKLD